MLVDKNQRQYFNISDLQKQLYHTTIELHINKVYNQIQIRKYWQLYHTFFES